MQVTLIALGSGAEETLTAQARAALRAAACILGAPRLLEGTGAGVSGPAHRRCPARGSNSAPSGRKRTLCRGVQRRYWILFRCAADVAPAAGAGNRGACTSRPFQRAAAGGRLGRPWQDWTLCSAHGTDCDPAAAVMEGKSTFFLTGGALGPAALCARLSEAGLGRLPVTGGRKPCLCR